MAKSKTLFWNAYARIYDQLLGTIPYQRLLKKTLDRVPIGAARLLDAGCGTGNLLNAARVRHPALALHGIDFSGAMLSLAQKKVAGAVLTVGDLNAPLPFPSDSFDVVTCINVLYAVSDPARTVAELNRVLKREGALIVSSPADHARIGPLVREHAAVVGWIRGLPTLAHVVLLILFNLLIVHRGRSGEYRFLDSESVRHFLPGRELERAYANQNWFVCTTKGDL